MSRYLSIDAEATGLTEECLLIQFAVVPCDASAKLTRLDLGREVLIQCPSFEELKPTLNSWVIDHNEGLIRKAHAEGIKREAFEGWLTAYLALPEVKEFFKDERPTFLGKSLSALDLPILHRYLGPEYMRKHFNHHTVDVTCVARALVDAGALPPGRASSSKLIQHFGIRNDVNHTALSDAVDMAEVYYKLLEVIKGPNRVAPTAL